ncbi:MAG: response regulator transcription factor [Candidatus Altiarchaeota archaeon]
MAKKIMVVDDDEDTVELISMILTDAGYKVETASGGQEALEKLEKDIPNLVLLDLMMPGMDGWTTLQKMKEKNITEKTKVSIFTVKEGPSTEIFGLQDVVADYIQKLVGREEFLSRIKEVLKD